MKKFLVMAILIMTATTACAAPWYQPPGGAATSVSDTDVLLINQGGVSRSATRGQISGGVSSGTYTPTAGILANLTSVTPYKAQWQRVGNIVTVSGRVVANNPASGANSRFRLSFPIASTPTQYLDCAGVAYSQFSDMTANIYGWPTGHAVFEFKAASSTGDNIFYYTYTYEVK